MITSTSYSVSVNDDDDVNDTSELGRDQRPLPSHNVSSRIMKLKSPP